MFWNPIFGGRYRRQNPIVYKKEINSLVAELSVVRDFEENLYIILNLH